MGSNKICEGIGMILTTGQRTTEVEGAAESRSEGDRRAGKSGTDSDNHPNDAQPQDKRK